MTISQYHAAAHRAQMLRQADVAHAHHHRDAELARPSLLARLRKLVPLAARVAPGRSDVESGPAQLGPEVGDGAMVGGRPGNEPELPTRPHETVVPAVGPLDDPPLLLGGSG